MPDSIALEVVTPQREIVRETVAEVQLPGLNGYLGILPEHTPLLTQLGIGMLSYKKGSQTRYVSVVGGFAEVLAERVTVLADVAERAEEIDVERARAALAKAEGTQTVSGADPAAAWEEVQAALRRARTRIEVASHANSSTAGPGK
jgi:F-type H+-transporting ATPase subunit epsilon